MSITFKQSEVLPDLFDARVGTMWHKSLPFAAVVTSTMDHLVTELVNADVPVLGDDRMAVIESAIAEHVKACLYEFAAS